MDLPRDLRVGWDKMMSREMQLEMWKIENEGVRKSLDELAQRYSAPGDEWRRHLPAMPLSLDRSSQTDASELQPVAEMDDERRHLRKELEKLRTESEDALRRQKLFYEAQLSKVGPELRAQAQKQVRALELEMEERLRAVRAACRVQLRNEVARATAQLRRGAAAGLAEAEVQVDAAEEEVEQRISQLSSLSLSQPQSAGPSLAAESREWWTQEREQLLHEAACRLQRQTSTLRRMAARIDQLEDELAVARIKEEGTKLEQRRRGGALLTSAEAELRLDAVRRHAQRLEAALEARRREADEAHSEAAELRRQLALVQGCAALRGHWLGIATTGTHSTKGEQSAEEEQVHAVTAPQRLTSWARVATTAAPPTQEPAEAERARSPPPMSTGTRATEEGFYPPKAQNQEVWNQLDQRDLTTETNISERATQSAHVTRDTGSVDRGQTDDDDDVITENATTLETVINSPGVFSEGKSQSWHSPHRNQEGSGRFRRIDMIRSPRSQVVHHVVDIEPDFSADYKRRYPRRRSRFERVRGEEMGYPIKYPAPSQQISSFTYENVNENQAWPSTYTERNLDSAEMAEEAASWEAQDVKGSVFNEVRESTERGAPTSARTVGARARVTKPRAVKASKAWSKPSDASKSETSSVDSPDQDAGFYDRMMQRMGGDAGQRPEGEQPRAWAASPLHAEEGRAARRAAWRRRAKARGNLSEQSASELEEIDRRRHQRQMHLQAMAARE